MQRIWRLWRAITRLVRSNHVATFRKTVGHLQVNGWVRPWSETGSNACKSVSFSLVRGFIGGCHGGWGGASLSLHHPALWEELCAPRARKGGRGTDSYPRSGRRQETQHPQQVSSTRSPWSMQINSTKRAGPRGATFWRTQASVFQENHLRSSSSDTLGINIYRCRPAHLLPDEYLKIRGRFTKWSILVEHKHGKTYGCTRVNKLWVQSDFAVRLDCRGALV